MAKIDKNGNWIDKEGRLVPPDKVKEIDRIQDEAVEEMVAIAKVLKAQMFEARQRIVARYDQALADIAKAGKVTREKWKGNSTLRSFSGDLVAERSVADRIVFMEAGRILEQNPPESFFTNPQTARAQQFLEKFSFVESLPKTPTKELS